MPVPIQHLMSAMYFRPGMTATGSERTPPLSEELVSLIRKHRVPPEV